MLIVDANDKEHLSKLKDEGRAERQHQYVNRAAETVESRIIGHGRLILKKADAKKCSSHCARSS